MKKFIFIAFGIILIAFIIVFLLSKNNTFKKIEIGKFKCFHFSYSNGYAMDSNVIYDVKCGDKCIASIKPNGVSESDATTLEFSEDDIDKLIGILKKYEVENWNGFDKVDKNVLDGDSFSFNMSMNNGDYISAHGYMRWPKNYGKVCFELDKFFGKYIKK